MRPGFSGLIGGALLKVEESDDDSTGRRATCHGLDSSKHFCFVELEGICVVCLGGKAEGLRQRMSEGVWP